MRITFCETTVKGGWRGHLHKRAAIRQRLDVAGIESLNSNP